MCITHIKECINGGFPVIYRKIKKFLITIYRIFKRILDVPFINPGYLNPYVYILYFRYNGKGVPLKQVASFHSFIKFSQILDKSGIEFFLSHGTLLGAVRQGAFAGRPGDIDLMIKDKYLDSLLKLHSTIEKNGFSIGRITINQPNPFYNVIIYHPRLGCLIGIHIFTLVTVENNRGNYYYWEKRDGARRKPPIIIYEDQLLNHDWSNIFYSKFKIPNNSERLLEDYYGINWMEPDSRQYAWIPK